MKPHTPVYRPILKHALETAWAHRELWPIAAVAGLAGSGSVVNDVLRQAKLAASIPTTSFTQTVGNFHVLGVYRDSLLAASPSQATIGTLMLVAIGILGLLGIAACQQIMLRVVHRAAAKKTQLKAKDLRKELAHPRLLRYLTLDVFMKLFVTNLMIATTLLVATMNVSTVIADAFFATIFSAAAFSLALTANVITMLALIGVARKDATVSQALGYAIALWRKHPLICLEMSLLLFATNLLISFAYDGALLLFGVPALFGFASALQSGSFFVYLATTALIALIVATITLSFAGFATTFTYASWAALAEYLDKRSPAPRAVVHSKRLLAQLKA